MCQQEIDALKTQLEAANRNAQTAQILGGQAMIADQIENRINPTPIPSFTVPNPNSFGCRVRRRGSVV